LFQKLNQGKDFQNRLMFKREGLLTCYEERYFVHCTHGAVQTRTNLLFRVSLVKENIFRACGRDDDFILLFVTLQPPTGTGTAKVTVTTHDY
jgi:hypothetical protein